jgi:hypothetical protein
MVLVVQFHQSVVLVVVVCMETVLMAQRIRALRVVMPILVRKVLVVVVLEAQEQM